ncbi:MAG: hypothetical protein IH987_18890 [Planctomycetes bacterium]|nr:hypothetical protein [Planctomycetota bacterium]
MVLEDRVEIGANTCIDRGSLSETSIGEGTKINNLVHIAHNVRVGMNVLICAGARVAGSSEIGNDVWIGTGAIIFDQIHVGENARVGAGSVVTGDVLPGETVIGCPARPIESPYRDRVEKGRVLVVGHLVLGDAVRVVHRADSRNVNFVELIGRVAGISNRSPLKGDVGGCRVGQPD